MNDHVIYLGLAILTAVSITAPFWIASIGENKHRLPKLPRKGGRRNDY